MTEKNCSNCKYAFYQDYGYSAYTVEGTSFECMLNRHPKSGFDVFYSEAKELKYAEECSRFEPGDRIEMPMFESDDEEKEWHNDLTEEQKTLLGNWAR